MSAPLVMMSYSALLVWVAIPSLLLSTSSALPAGGSCDAVRDVMTSLKLAHSSAVSDSPVAGKTP